MWQIELTTTGKYTYSTFSYKGKHKRENASRSLTSNGILSNRYGNKNISGTRMKQVNEQMQQVLHPNASVSKDSNNDILVGLDFRHSFNYNTKSRSPGSRHSKVARKSNDSFEYKYESALYH